MKKLSVDYVKEIEMHFIKENFGGNHSHIIKKGSLPVMISSPHSVPQIRMGSIKCGEYLTGVLSHTLHKTLNCFCAYKTKNVNDDANFDKHNIYKDDLIKCITENKIKYMLDLHIMAPERDNMIDIGTNHGKNISNDFLTIQKVINIFNKNGINKIEIDGRFQAGGNTVSHVIAEKCNIMAMQVEINWRLLDVTDGLDNFMKVLNSLHETINFLAAETEYKLNK